jgi:hypothetical protein
MATYVVGMRRTITRRPPVGNHAATHGLVGIAVVRRIASHGHGAVFHVPLRDDPALRRGPSRVLVILSIAEGVSRRLLLLVRLLRGPWRGLR